MLLLYYSLFVFIPYVIDIEQEMSRRHHLIERGYDFAVRPFLLEAILKEMARYARYFFPVLNIFSILDLMDDKYKRFDKKDIKKMLSRGEIKPVTDNFRENDKDLLEIIASRKTNMNFSVAELTKDSLVEQAYAIKLMNISDAANLKETWRDLSTDRKIEFLLGELEALYYEKAIEMGIDLDQELEQVDAIAKKNKEEAAKKLKIK